jgi:hypothetical protein
MASSWIVKFSLGWGELAREERQKLERHFSTLPTSGTSVGETWKVKVRSDTAATAVHDVSLILGPDRQRRLVHISASEDLAERVRGATPW